MEVHDLSRCEVSKYCTHQKKRKITKYLVRNDTETLIHALATSRLDYLTFVTSVLILCECL